VGDRAPGRIINLAPVDNRKRGRKAVITARHLLRDRDNAQHFIA